MVEPISTASLVAAAKQAQEVIPKTQKLWVWLNKRRYPKAKKNNIGIAIAIATEKSVQREQITSDFFDRLNDLISSSSIKRPLELIDVPQHHAVKVKSMEDAVKVLERTRCILTIYGKARKRNIKGEFQYVLDLKAAVSHALIPIEHSNILANEMAELLPERRFVSRACYEL